MHLARYLKSLGSEVRVWGHLDPGLVEEQCNEAGIPWAIHRFRWALLGKEAGLYPPGFLISIGLAITLFMTGALFFTKTERKFAHII